MVHERDPRTGRPSEEGRDVAAVALSDNELHEELLISASAAGRLRIERYQALLYESAQRRGRSITPGEG